MARNRSKSFQYAGLIVLIIAGSWAWQKWTAGTEIIVINGKKVSVIDGDSFKNEGEEFRLFGIDAPEYRQTCNTNDGNDWPCGKAARTGLELALKKGQFSCDVRARDKFGRTIVICRDAQNQDLGSSLVEDGFAVSGQYFDESAYGEEEAVAKAARRGIWEGTFVRPDIWRVEHPRK